ncbi:MAG: DUF262 domain-containing protein [Lachnospiraceae bacterium]|nr:DUF262 domain-containing protein [Lachnospiraceae bacterium]
MRNENYKLTQYSINTILNDVETSQIAIPQLQRPFVWKGKQVKELIDSLYQGYPIGYLIVWQNSSVRLKEGGKSFGKKILIDGQQRITALMAAILGKEILDDKYQKKRIQIGFNPCAKEEEEVFVVYGSKYESDPRWIPDISVLFRRDFAYRRFESEYLEKNPDTDPKKLDEAVSRLKDLAYNEVGVIELSFLLDIDVVTEIFIRINSQGKPLNQEDFAMSKISVNEEMGGDLLQKAIDHFCHLCLMPEDGKPLLSRDEEFRNSEYGQAVSWLCDIKQNLYIPTYSDVLKTAFAYKFGRGKIGELVNMLSGKNPETKEISQNYGTEVFLKLKAGIMDYMAEDNFGSFLSILQEGGYIRDKMMGSKALLNGTYSVFLLLKEEGITGDLLRSCTMKWYILNALTGRYQLGFETVLAKDFREIKERGFVSYFTELSDTLLSRTFWEETMPEKLKTTMIRSNCYATYLAAMVKNEDYSLFSHNKKMKDLIADNVENSQLFPRVYLEKHGIKAKELYGQVANCIYMDKEVKAALKRKPPIDYLEQMFAEPDEEVKVGKAVFSKEELLCSLQTNAIPGETGDMGVEDFEEFLSDRRSLMADKIHAYYESFSLES